jgi:hypothetical protein
MGRKRTAEDYHRTAEENGWVPGAHEQEDNVQQTKDEPSERYKQNQQEALDQWIMWVLTPATGSLRGASALFLPRNADQIHEVSCQVRAFLPRSACRRTAQSLATCSLKTSLDGTASPVLAGVLSFCCSSQYLRVCMAARAWAGRMGTIGSSSGTSSWAAE